jgi:hypothetical protein
MNVEVGLIRFHPDTSKQIVRTIATAFGQIKIVQQLEICSETFWIDSHDFTTSTAATDR